MSDERIPDVLLVRKGYRVGKRAGKRKWKLKKLNMTAVEGAEPTRVEEEQTANGAANAIAVLLSQ